VQQCYMLDTNTVSYLIKGTEPAILGHLKAVPMASVCVSSITEAELLHGVAKKPEAKRLSVIVNEFLLRVEILPWDSNVAQAYAVLRAACEAKGRSLGIMDMLIAAHAYAVDATLITNDKGFNNIAGDLMVEDWTISR